MTAPLNVMQPPAPADSSSMPPTTRDATKQTASPTGSSNLPLDPRTYARALSCVHCGLCLPACPTYTETGHEADSPRGRIQLMRGLADGLVQPTHSVRHHLDLCLDCRGCETACPSGVVYHELIEETRAHFASLPGNPPGSNGSPADRLQSRFMRWMFFHIFTHPTRLKLALLPARLLQKLGVYRLLRKTGAMKLLPNQLRKMDQMLPPDGDLWPEPLPQRVVDAGHGFAPARTALHDERGARKAAAERSITTAAPTPPPSRWRSTTSTRSCPRAAPARTCSARRSPAAARCFASTTSSCATTRSTLRARRNSHAACAMSAKFSWSWVSRR